MKDHFHLNHAQDIRWTCIIRFKNWLVLEYYHLVNCRTFKNVLRTIDKKKKINSIAYLYVNLYVDDVVLEKNVLALQEVSE